MSFLPGSFPGGAFAGQAAAFPAVVNTNTGEGTLGGAGNIAVPLPASLVSGNLLIIIVSLFQSAARDSSAPSGWTELFDIVGPTNIREFSCYYKVSDGSEGASVNVAISGSLTGWAANSYQISGFTGAPEATTTTGNNSAPNPPSLTPSWGSAKTLWLAACAGADNGAAAITAAPSNYTDLIQASHLSGSDPIPVVASARRELEATSDDPAAFGQSGTFNDWAAATIGIRPS
jgi:hypothetical protein